MQKRSLGRTGIDIAPLVFGGNVFGWTADETVSFAMLDRFAAAGLDTIDTADAYSKWVPGHQGGESETIIGKWLKRAPGRRDEIVVITKVGVELAPDKKGLSAKRIVAAAEESLRRLQTDRIDVYLSHFPDADTPIEETLRGYESLLRDGKVRAIGCSNYDAAQLGEALRVSSEQGLPQYQVLQPEYNLYDRGKFEGELQALCLEMKIGVVTYFSLASGFLTGKYRSREDLTKSVRGSMIEKYLDDKGMRILAALDDVADAHGASAAEVALAWLIARDGVTAPIASATSVEQVDSLINATRLSLSASEIEALTRAGE